MGTALPRIVIVGTGNVATALATRLCAVGCTIAQIVGRTPAHADALARAVSSQAVYAFDAVDRTADLYLLALSDRAIAAIAHALPLVDGIVAHTAGSVSIDILARFSNRGVFYPLQTFSPGRTVDWERTPLLLEANGAQNFAVLQQVAQRVSANARECNSTAREAAHLAAVFACNFTNHCYVLAERVLATAQLPFDLVRPIIAEAAAKVQTQLPRAAQTGPAIRGDTRTMDRHLARLANDPELAATYRALSAQIGKKLS